MTFFAFVCSLWGGVQPHQLCLNFKRLKKTNNVYVAKRHVSLKSLGRPLTLWALNFNISPITYIHICKIFIITFAATILRKSLLGKTLNDMKKQTKKLTKNGYKSGERITFLMTLACNSGSVLPVFRNNNLEFSHIVVVCGS